MVNRGPQGELAGYTMGGTQKVERGSLLCAPDAPTERVTNRGVIRKQPFDALLRQAMCQLFDAPRNIYADYQCLSEDAICPI
jgi:hypothetical protein